MQVEYKVESFQVAETHAAQVQTLDTHAFILLWTMQSV